jgi:hypothetical protein
MKELSLFNLKSYISDAIDDNNRGKMNFLDILDWLMTWDKELEENKRLFCYKRESINIEFTTIPNRNKKSKPAFMVIKSYKNQEAYYG